MMPRVIRPLISAATGTASASAAVAAHPIEEKASAKVASRDEVWRRRNWLRLACTRNQSWIAVAEAAAMTTPSAVTAACSGEANSSASDQRREDHADRDQHHFDLGAGHARGRQRRGRHQIGGVFARDRQPGEAAGELARRHDDDRRDQHDGGRNCRKSCATASAPAAPDTTVASGSATPARDRAAAARIPSGAAPAAASRRGTPCRAEP